LSEYIEWKDESSPRRIAPAEFATNKYPSLTEKYQRLNMKQSFIFCLKRKAEAEKDAPEIVEQN
jgi:hypothetical protein